MPPTSSDPSRPLLRRRALLGAAAGALLLALVPGVRHGVTALAGQQDDGPWLTVATWNTCGIDAWGCTPFGDGKAKADTLVALAEQHGARVLLLQEACEGDAEAARQRLGADWHLALQPYEQLDATGARTPVDCGADRGRAGYGVLAAAPLTGTTPVAAPQPATGLQRGALCTTPGHGPRICAAHLSLPPADRSDRAAELRDDQLAALLAAAGDGAVLGGDFNARPPGPGNRDSWIWPTAYYDRVQECEQRTPGSPGRPGPTHDNGEKLDYLFTALPRHGCRIVDTGASDHRALLLTVPGSL
ncbi:endonuclease/exonuclease/phosphatase family protein [Kitasatospora phosalacinea]|uniref:endonuclease/exonuclease/phosphatase family protein n=1 Tax=Kitasatospora phosalacinea TaxID=2065 RepID=UPI002554A187|nr:endonuclease/exonuclease/phosphatase family protein [Kitasatospora phosalacinea]